MNDRILSAAALKLDATHRTVSINGQVIVMGPAEYRLLCFFMTHPERVYSGSQLLDLAGGGNAAERAVEASVRRLRKALEPYGYDRLIQTVRGAGYRFSLRPLRRLIVQR